MVREGAGREACPYPDWLKQQIAEYAGASWHVATQILSERLVSKNNIVILLGLAIALGGCEKAPAVPAATAAVEAAALTASETSVAGIALPVRVLPVASEAVFDPPSEIHHYKMEGGGEYGYLKEISADDRNRGVATSTLVMARYKGIHGGVYTIDLYPSAGSINRLECKNPCNYVKVKLILDGELLDSATIPVTEGSMIAAVLDDARNGRLNVYLPHRVHVTRNRH